MNKTQPLCPNCQNPLFFQGRKIMGFEQPVNEDLRPAMVDGVLETEKLIELRAVCHECTFVADLGSYDDVAEYCPDDEENNNTEVG